MKIDGADVSALGKLARFRGSGGATKVLEHLAVDVDVDRGQLVPLDERVDHDRMPHVDARGFDVGPALRTLSTGFGAEDEFGNAQGRFLPLLLPRRFALRIRDTDEDFLFERSRR